MNIKKKSPGIFLILTTALVYPLALVGPLSSLNQIYLLFVLAVLSIVSNTSKAVDQILVVCVTTLGLIPIFGWINTPEWFNPLQLIIVAWFYVIVQNWERKIGKAQEIVSIIPLTVAPAFGFQWWKGMSEGDPVSVLTRILPIWDLSGHFAVFYNNLVDDTYIPRKAQPGEGLMWAFREYPSGIHYVWAQFAKADRPQILENSDLAIPIFTNSVVVTLVLSTLIVNFSIWRLANANYLRVAFSTISSGVAVALITLGPLSQTISTGFANIPAVIIAVSVYLSFAIKPHINLRIQFLILGCSILCMSYNWYPVLLLLAPSFVFLFICQLRKTRKWEALLFLILLSFLSAMPLLQTLSLGIKHLELQGGVQPFPSGFLVTVLIGAAAIGLWVNSVTRKKLFLTINLPAPVFALVLGGWLRLRTDAYPYYFHKASLFIATYAIFAILFTVAAVYGIEKQLATTPRFSQKLQIVFAAALMGFGASQMFGYWGLDYTTFSGQSSAYGVLSRNEFLRTNNLNRPSAFLVINQAKRFKEMRIGQKSCSTLMIPSEIGANDKNFISTWKGSMENIWFHALSNSLTTEAQQLAYMTVSISQVANNFDLFVDAIKKTFHPPSTCVVTSSKVKSEIENLPWKSLRVFIE